jgi:hypothetical protein
VHPPVEQPTEKVLSMTMSSKAKAEEKPLVDPEVEDFPDDDEFIEEAEEELEKALTEDIYSLLYTAPLCGYTYVFATLISLLQGGLLMLIFLDLVDLSSNPRETNGSPNRIDLPAGTELEVTIAQFVGMLLTIMVNTCILNLQEVASLICVDKR